MSAAPIKHDVSVPVAMVAGIRRAGLSAAAQAVVPGCLPCPFGHLGDGNVHFNVTQPPGADKAAFLARWGEVNAAVFAVVAQASKARSRPTHRQRRDEARG